MVWLQCVCCIPPPCASIDPHHHAQVQRCTLLSIKTGGCPENCNYCSQSSHWSKDTGTKAEKLMDLEDVYQVCTVVCGVYGFIWWFFCTVLWWFLCIATVYECTFGDVHCALEMHSSTYTPYAHIPRHTHTYPPTYPLSHNHITNQAALRAKEAGSTRFCMGAAWRGPSQVGARQWDRVLDMVKRIRALDMEVCTTLGMLNNEQAQQLREAGLTAYNHNLDTSPEYYGKITTTRKYEVRVWVCGGWEGYVWWEGNVWWEG